MTQSDDDIHMSGDLKHDVYTDPFCSKANQARIRDAIGRLDSGLGTEHELIETDDIDPFYSESNVRELKRRLDDIKAGTASLEEHELIEKD